MHLTPIGTFHCQETYPYDAPRQGTLAQENTGTIHLTPHQNYEQALQNLQGFSHIWLLFQFHRNQNWKPLVTPPRGQGKVGLFASRAPYRPNPIGLSCVRLINIDGLTIHVADHDLLQDTPILDIKPYIPYADAFPDATPGWTQQLDEPWNIHISARAKEQLDWLTKNGVPSIEAFIHQQLTHDPLNPKKKRLQKLSDTQYQLAYRTWRITFTTTQQEITIEKIESAYTPQDLANQDDPHKDKKIHRDYVQVW